MLFYIDVKLVSHIKERTHNEGVWEQDAEKILSKKDKVIGGWKELQNLYPLQNIIRETNQGYDIGRTCSMQGTDEKCVQNFSQNT